MSANSVSRWNAIPLTREPETSLKRPRPEQDGDDDDDDISIASRTPSPPPDAMDVDDPTKYDEYVSGTPREVITVETKIKPTNKGFAMLAKLGWAEGQPLGISGDGRVDPIPFQIKRDLTGLGKTNQDVRMIETTVSQRRGLDSERQQKETEDQRRAREDLVARKTALESEISTTLKAFYCTLCDKQFKTVAQYDEHTNSYAHHHKARFKDMQANVRLKPKEEVDKRKEKERKREEKELRKIAAANGIKMAKPAAALDVTQSTSKVVEADPDPPPPKKAGWASIDPGPQGGVKKSGWASVGAAPLASLSIESTVPVSSSAAHTSNNTSTSHSGSAPAFRTAGWTSLDTGSSQAFPSDQPPKPISDASGSSNNSARAGQPRSVGGWNASLNPPPPSDPPPPPSNPPAPTTLTTPASQPVRTGWQQLQKSKSGKK